MAFGEGAVVHFHRLRGSDELGTLIAQALRQLRKRRRSDRCRRAAGDTMPIGRHLASIEAVIVSTRH